MYLNSLVGMLTGGHRSALIEGCVMSQLSMFFLSSHVHRSAPKDFLDYFKQVLLSDVFEPFLSSIKLYLFRRKSRFAGKCEYSYYKMYSMHLISRVGSSSKWPPHSICHNLYTCISPKQVDFAYLRTY